VGGSGDALDRSAVSLTAPGPRGCYDPADFGATPNDGIDDRIPSQQALDAASVGPRTRDRVAVRAERGWALPQTDRARLKRLVVPQLLFHSDLGTAASLTEQ
jgi:hypothetical protein